MVCWWGRWVVRGGLRGGLVVDGLRLVVDWRRWSWLVGGNMRLVGGVRRVVGGRLGAVGRHMLIHWSRGRISRWVVGSRTGHSVNSVRGVLEADTNTGHVTVMEHRVVTLVR